MENNAKEARIAALNAEIDAIHSANILYWRQGGAATHEARAEYRHRLDRLEEIRMELAKLRSLTDLCSFQDRFS
jgi:hypothetical protein